MCINKLVFLSIILATLLSCAKKSSGIMKTCNLDYAKEIADNFMKRKRYNLQEYNREVAEEDSLFIITYRLKDPYTAGGGAQIKISNSNCKTIRVTLYQ